MRTGSVGRGHDDCRQETPAFAPFDGEMAAKHRRLAADEYENSYVVGDVHGCLTELRTLWDRLDPGPSDVVVFVGDLVRKGPASVEVVKFVESRPNAVSVRGNNEAKIIHGRVDTTPFESVTDIIASFPLAVSWEDSLVVHGGVDPRRTLREHDPSDVLEMRAVPPENGYDGPFWFELYGGQPRVFFGHTVLDAPYVTDGAVGLDTGCVYGGSLTAYDCTREQTVSVPAERTYQQRPDDKILDVDP